MSDAIALEVYAGRDRDITYAVTLWGVELDITDAVVTLNVKKSRDATSNVLTLVSPTNITITAPLVGTITYKFTDTMTDGLAGIYWCELVVVQTGGEEYKIAEGTLSILP